jgi:hypothetical protein
MKQGCENEAGEKYEYEHDDVRRPYLVPKVNVYPQRLEQGDLSLYEYNSN